MAHVLEGQCFINGKDIWKEYGAFLRADRNGSYENINSLLAPAKMKPHVAVNIREQDGEHYSQQLTPKSEGRDITLHFCITDETAGGFVDKYLSFIELLKKGNNGWLEIGFPLFGLNIHVYADQFPSGFTSISNLWHEGRQAGAFKVKFREPISLL